MKIKITSGKEGSEIILGLWYDPKFINKVKKLFGDQVFNSIVLNSEKEIPVKLEIQRHSFP